MFPNIQTKNLNTNEIKKDNKKERKKEKKKVNLKTSLKLCSICLGELQNAVIDYSITRCNHNFCTSCLLKHIKYSEYCPLCRTKLAESNTKFKLDFNISESIVNKELEYYNDYIKEGIDYTINTTEYHIKNNTFTNTVKMEIKDELIKMFQNFGMGVCLNVNTTFKNLNVFNTGSPINRTDSVFDLSNIEHENINLENTIISYNDT